MALISQSFRVLGDDTRLRILRLLAEAPLNVSELVSVVGIGQSSVSHHLAKLKSALLIREERQAAFTYYSLGVAAGDQAWPLVKAALDDHSDEHGDRARLKDLLRQREDRTALNEKLLEPGQSWFLWAHALGRLMPPLEVADFGCGSGMLSVAIARWAKRVLAIDWSEAALQTARERAAREGAGNVEFLRGDLRALDLASRSLDLVVISQSLHHVEQPAKVLREAARVLKPRGRAVVLELLPHGEAWVRERLGHRTLGFEPAALEADLEAAGFIRIATELPAQGAESPFRVFMTSGEVP